jgi:hypothetical protein
MLAHLPLSCPLAPLAEGSTFHLRPQNQNGPLPSIPRRYSLSSHTLALLSGALLGAWAWL